MAPITESSTSRFAQITQGPLKGVKVSILYQLVFVASMLTAGLRPALATENAVSTPNGADGFLAGALPPPGVYNLFFGNYYQSTRLNDNNGNSALPGFKITAKTVADKVVLMTNQTMLGGQVGFYGALGLQNIRIDMPGLSDSRTGLNDIEGGMGVAWHPAEDLHWYGLVSVIAPTGAYDAKRLVNLGSNYTTIRPQFGISYIPKSGLDLSARLTYSFPKENKATNYRSGQYFHVDYNAGFALSDSWKLGLQGYYLQQTTDDKFNGAVVGPDGNRARVLAIGPGVVYQSQGVPYELKYLKETLARNRPSGDSVWMKVALKF